MERNTTIPTRKSQIFTTAADLQSEVTIHVLQGERPMAADNISLGRFNLVGIAPAPRGVPQIEVTFDIDASGILNVTAKDLGTGKEQKMTITASTKLPDRDVDRMVKEAQQFASDDEKRKEEATARNEADSLVYTAEKTIADLGEKIPTEAEGEDRIGGQGREVRHRGEGYPEDQGRHRCPPEGPRRGGIGHLPGGPEEAGRGAGPCRRSPGRTGTGGVIRPGRAGRGRESL